MKSRRKTLPSVCDTVPVFQNGTPLKQTTITECFTKKVKRSSFTMERFHVSDVIIEIDSDSDVETPVLDFKCSPSPPKKAKIMIGVHMPSPIKAVKTENWPMPQISGIESLNTSSQTHGLITGTPNVIASDSSNKTIGQTVGGSAVQYSPDNTPKSTGTVIVQETLIINDPKNFVDDAMQDVLDNTNNHLALVQRTRRELFVTPSSKNGGTRQIDNAIDPKREPPDGPEENNVSDKENCQEMGGDFQQLSSLITSSKSSRTLVPVNINQSISTSVASVDDNVIATSSQPDKSEQHPCSDKVQNVVKNNLWLGKKKSRTLDLAPQMTCSQIPNLPTENGSKNNDTSSKTVKGGNKLGGIRNNKKNGLSLKKTTSKAPVSEAPQLSNSTLMAGNMNKSPTSNAGQVIDTPEKTVKNGRTSCSKKASSITLKKVINDGQAPSCSKSLGLNTTQNASTSNGINAETPTKSANQGIASPTRNTISSPKKRKPFSGGNPFKVSPVQRKNLEIKTLKAKEGKQLQIKQLKELVDLFGHVLANRHLSNLLSTTERDVLKRFEAMAGDEKYFVMKLFVWKRTWYNIHKFCKIAQIQVGDQKDVTRIFECLKRENYVDTDYIESANMIDLLTELDKHNVKEVMDELRITPRVRVQKRDENGNKTNKKERKGFNCTKEELIESIVIATSTQATLTKRTLQDMVMDEIKKKLGYAIKIKEEVYDAFHNAYLLATFTNPDFDDIQIYFRSIIHLSVTFPSAPIEERVVFFSREDFLNYARALKIRRHLDLLNKREKFEIYNIGEEAYDYLRDLQRPDSDKPSQYHTDAPHLKRFTSEHVYCAILSTCCENLFTKQNGKPAEVQKWLEFMIENYPQSRRLGKWYFRLITLHMRHLEPISYKAAAKLLIEALSAKKNFLGEVALFELGSMSQKLQSVKRYKMDQIYYDRLAELTPPTIDPSKFPQQQIDSQCIRSDESGRKRVYITKSNDEATLKYVESVALDYYAENGYAGGEHCEGSLMRALLLLYFWDIIYNPEKSVPGTFISKLQAAPLDMFTPQFYENRKEAIEARLLDIDSKWPEDQLIEFGANNWQAHSHETTAFGMVMNVIKDAVTVEVLITVIGRKILVGIFERLIENIREFSSGMPDLLVWNIDDKLHKFVEVKGEGDQLRPNQILWLNYLQKIGASIEVCWVHSAGSKRKKIKKVLPEIDGGGDGDAVASTSRDEESDNN